MKESDLMVSVIVPVFNDAERLDRCLEALARQTYQPYEVIVVDNGSTDASKAVAAARGVVVLERPDVQSSYAARNTGLRRSTGDVLAFTDSDCTPKEDWLAQGVAALEGADLVGGRVQFTFRGRPTAAELFDSISNMQIERNIAERGIAKTANLFVRRAVFEDLGPFHEVGSGGDVGFTRAATRAGCVLLYAEAAVIEHPARTFTELMRKQVRVGRGKPALGGKSTLSIIKTAVWLVTHPSWPENLRARLIEAGHRPTGIQVWKVFAVGLLARAATAVGNLCAIVNRSCGSDEQ